MEMQLKLNVERSLYPTGEQQPGGPTGVAKKRRLPTDLIFMSEISAV